MSSRFWKTLRVLGAEADWDVRIRMECSLTWPVKLYGVETKMRERGVRVSASLSCSCSLFYFFLKFPDIFMYIYTRKLFVEFKRKITRKKERRRSLRDVDYQLLVGITGELGLLA